MMVKYERQVESKPFKFVHVGDCFVIANIASTSEIFMRVPLNHDVESTVRKNAIRLRDGEPVYILMDEQCVVIEPKEEIVFVDKREE